MKPLLNAQDRSKAYKGSTETYVNSQIFSTRCRHTSRLVAGSLRAATRPHFGPVVGRRGVPAAGRAAVVDARVRLAGGGGATGAVRPVARHVRLDARLGARKVVGTRLPAGPRSAAVLPVGVLDLVGATAQRTDVHDAADVRVAVGFHLTNALHAPIGELS